MFRKKLTALRLSLCAFLFCMPALVFAEKYLLEDIKFNSLGKTKPAYLIQNIPPLQKGHEFNSKEELESYLAEVKQNLENTRLLINITYNYNTTSTEDETSKITAEYTFEDSTSLLIFPKPGLDSNKGAELEIALKDTNFLGLASPLKAGITFEFGDKEEPTKYSRFTPGFNINYNYPFYIGKTKNHWDTLLDFRWCTEKDFPNVIYTTGVTVGVPFGKDGKHEVDFTARQSIMRDTDYLKFHDEFYFIEYGEIAVPLNVGSIGLSTPVYYKPIVSIEKKWDKDGINEDNCDLYQTPVLKPGQELYFSHIDWAENNNFRTGYSFKTGTYLGFDLHEDETDKRLIPSAEAYIKLFKSFENAGANLNLTVLCGHNTRYAIGTYLRGAPDESHFARGINADANNYALTTNSAIVLNLEFPVHILTTDWVSFFGAAGEKHKGFFNAMNFEMQLGPFTDIALLDNWGTKNTFDYKEGIYTAGIECLIYPKKWKSYVLRASYGFDLSKKLLDGKHGFDSSWRDGKETECYIGLTLQF